MMRSIVMPRMQWVSRSLILLAALFLLVGCSRALEEKLEGKERELAEIRTALAEIEGKLAASEAARAKDTEHLQQVERQREELMGQVTGLDNQRTLLEQELARSRDELANRRQALETLQQAHHILKDQVAARGTELQQALEQLRGERDILLASRAKAEEAASNLAGQVAELATQITQLTSAQSLIGNLNEMLSSLEETRRGLEQRLNLLDADLRRTREELVAAEAEKSASTQQASALTAQVQQLQTTLLETTKELGGLSARVKLIPDLEQRVTAVQQERDTLRNDLQQLRQEYAAARVGGERASGELAQIREDLDASQRELAAARAGHQEAGQRASQLKGQVEALQQELTRAGVEREQMRVQLSDLSGQRGTLQTQLASVTRLKEEADDRIARLSTELAATKNDLGQTVQARDAAHKEVRILSGKLEAAQKELEIVSLARADLEARASQLRQQLSTTTDKVLDLTDDVRRLQEHLRNGALNRLTALPRTLTKGIGFSYRRSSLTDDAKRLLDQAVGILQQYPAVRLVIEGYTDSRGDKGFNRLLSQHRANAVREYLIRQGVAPERLVAIGRGGDNPIASNTTPQGRILNRRIEFHLTQMDGRRGGEDRSPAAEGSSSPVQLEFRQPPQDR